MDLWDHCCGAAGIYNLDHPELSGRILDEKLDALERSGASVLLTGNPGCLMQWRAGVAKRGLRVEVLHLATFLAGQVTA
jgi:glycolate oxidase iron-sulfur subunit